MRRLVKRSILPALLFGALSCTDSNAPNPPAAPPPPPAPPPSASFGIRPGVDTLLVGDEVRLVAERADSTVDQWSVSDTSLARVAYARDGWAVVLARASGTVSVKATHAGDSGQATLVIPPPAPTGDWETIDLGALDGQSSTAFAINDSGTIVGRLYRPDSGYYSGFVYKDGVMRRLAGPGMPLAIGPSGRIAGLAFYGTESPVVVWDTPDAAPRRLGGPDDLVTINGVTALGDVIAYRGDILGSYRTELWRNDIPQDLGTLKDSMVVGTRARGWNSRGQVVGESRVDRFGYQGDWVEVLHPFLWEDGVMRDLGFLATIPCRDIPRDCSGGEAADINEHGVVVGTSSAGSLARAFIWENGVMRELGAFPGHYTSAEAINDRGQILGTVGYGDTAFVWDEGHSQTIVGVGLRVIALGPDGEVIGTTGKYPAPLRGFIWHAGEFIELGAGQPVAINNRSEVIGTRGDRAILWRKRRG